MSGSPCSRKLGLVYVALVWLVAITLLVSGCGAKKAKMYRIGMLCGLEFVSDITDGFKAGMAELGYVDGENIVYDVQTTNFDMAAYRAAAERFVADKVDMIVVYPTEATLEVKAVTEGTDIPVIFAFAFIEDTGLVNSVREPGGNMTGVRYPGPDIALKRLEIMMQLAPDAKRILIPYQRGYPTIPCQLAVLYPAAQAAGVTLIEAPVDDAAELEAVLQAQVQGEDPGMDAIMAVAEPLFVTAEPFAVAARFAYDHHLPIGGALMSADGYGSVFGVNVDIAKTGKQAAPLADKVLKGMPAGTIPVVSSENFVQIDYRVAQQLGVTVPDGLLKQADEVIR